MTVGMSDFVATGGLVTFGGPTLAAICIVNAFCQKKKVNWYILAPFIQAYVVIGSCIALFGPRITTSPIHTVLLVLAGCILSTIAICGLVKSGTSWRPNRLAFSSSGQILNVFGLLLVFTSIQIFLIFTSAVEDFCNFRCRAYSNILGYGGYWGGLIIPTIILNTISTFVYFLFLVAKKEKSHNGDA